MAYTFSEGLSTTYYSENKTALTDVLQLLPDNTNKEITPRDVRDAVFSAWENTVFKYVEVDSIEYIGFSRDEIKGKKIFFGKKQISGSNILTSPLSSSSEADIFFYNTKLDSSLTQNFRAVFLAGTNSNLFLHAPYIQSTQVSGANPYISLSLVNPATHGTVALQSGLSGSVVINNLYFPSTQSVAASIATPEQSLPGDLFLAVRGSGNIELLTYNNGGGSYLTQSAVQYSNPTPMVTSIGGFTVGTTFNNVPYQVMWDTLLYPDIGPFASLNITQTLFANRTLERDHNISNTTLTSTYTLIKRTNDILSTNLTYQAADPAITNTSTGISLSGVGLTSSTQNFIWTVAKADIASYTSSGLFTFSVIPSDGTSTYIASQTVEFVFPYIYAFSRVDYPMNNTGMTNLFGSDPYSKVINTYGSQSIALTNPSYATGSLIYFMYPTIHGTLSQIKDGNDFSEVLNGGTWTYSFNVPLNDPTGKWSANYNIYKKFIPVSIVPSQNYKFIF